MRSGGPAGVLIDHQNQMLDNILDNIETSKEYVDEVRESHTNYMLATLESELIGFCRLIRNW